MAGFFIMSPLELSWIIVLMRICLWRSCPSLPSLWISAVTPQWHQQRRFPEIVLKSSSMGTVPDSLRLTKASLTVVPGEEELLQDQQSSLSQQTSLIPYSNANNSLLGFPSESVRIGFLDLGCPGPVETIMKDSEHDLTQTVMSSGISNEVEKLSPTDSTPSDSSQPQGHSEHAAQVPAPRVDLNLTHSVVPVNQDAGCPQPCDDPETLAILVVDKTPQPQGASDAEDPEKSDKSSKDQELCIDSPEKRQGKAKTLMTTSEIVLQSATPVSRSEGGEQPVDLNLETRLPIHSEREEREESFVIALTTSAQSSTTSQQSGLSSKHSGCFPEQEKTLEAQPLSSRFKEMGTMTSLDESGFLAERANRIWQDAEVQTITSMESRSVATSPSMLATFLREIPASETLEQQEQLCVIYQSSSKANNPLDKLEGPREASCGFGNKTEVHIQAAAAASSNVSAFQVEKKSTDSAATNEEPASKNGLSGLCFLKTSNDSTNICKEEWQAVEMATEGKRCIITQSTPTTFLPPNAKPVYPISAHVYNEAEVSPGLGKADPKSSELSMKTINNQQPERDSSDAQREPLSPDDDLNKRDDWSVRDKDGTTEKPLPTQIGKEGETVDSKAAIKPRVETKPELLCPTAGGNNSVGLTVSPGNAITPTTGRKNQDRASEESKQAKAVTSLGLPTEMMGDSSPNSGKRTPSRSVKASPRRASRVSEFLKEQKLNVTAAAAQVGFMPGEKKKQLGADSKLQFKQSKQVRDVIWDDQGMTWEVYGASLDPESLGIAIQNHLQRQIREHEKLIKGQSNQNRKSISSDTSSNKKLKGRQHNMFQAMMQNFRRPNCCVHPAPSSVLD
ncbi:G protein-regulated inducer of neurite outgrowth 3 [Monodelphis domestica]|uniref:G protein-regulated inducer of neurite outgrowth 3 n=1 Tax=Monodelphis domestica TaxID=13616 RepID=UPI0024E26E82|nr:G protein-regulated inducer of neurite outgrowth 3 [Monodelphis domestica]